METLEITCDNWADEKEELEYWKEINSKCCEAESLDGAGAWMEADTGRYDDRY